MGSDYYSRNQIRPIRRRIDGKKKWDREEASSLTSANLEILIEAAKFQSSFSEQSRIIGRNSRSPGKRNPRIQPVFMSQAEDDLRIGHLVEKLGILRSRPETSTKHVAFDASSWVDPHQGCSKCKHVHFSADRLPSRIVSAKELNGATDGYSLDNAMFDHCYDDNLFKGTLDGCWVYVSRRTTDEIRLNYLTEIDILKTLHHPNVICLKAVCKDIDSLALVFNFVCSRTISFHLSHKNFGPRLAWPARVKLAIQLAKGLAYLHDCSIIHGNINSLNVFVTHDFVPVIGGFSFARKRVAGHQMFLPGRSKDKKARGYLAPEYRIGGESSEKQDIYAFGVILIELISGRPPFNKKAQFEFLGEWGRNTIEELELDPLQLMAEILDPELHEQSQWASIMDMIKVAKLCLQVDPNKRPPMMEVLTDLKECAV